MTTPENSPSKTPFEAQGKQGGAPVKAKAAEGFFDCASRPEIVKHDFRRKETSGRFAQNDKGRTHM
jgi:hypothetical protein